MNSMGIASESCGPSAGVPRYNPVAKNRSPAARPYGKKACRPSALQKPLDKRPRVEPVNDIDVANEKSVVCCKKFPGVMESSAGSPNGPLLMKQSEIKGRLFPEGSNLVGHIVRIHADRRDFFLSKELQRAFEQRFPANGRERFGDMVGYRPKPRAESRGQYESPHGRCSG